MNEAMACGLPVILSQAAGCGADLVSENWNGLLIPPKDVSRLAAAMESLASQPDLRTRMGANSLRHISHYSPGQWSLGSARATAAGGEPHD